MPGRRKVLDWFRTRGARTVLIGDIAGSTALYERLGDDRARRLVAGRIEALSECSSRHRGQVVKTMGDAILCLFDSPEEALHAATAMTLAHDDQEGSSRLRVKIGLHRGEVLLERGDIFGDTVNTVARVASLAKPGEILLTREVFDALPRTMRDKARSVHSVVLKGKRDAMDLYTISGGDEIDSQLTVQPRRAGSRLRFDLLELTWYDGKHLLDAEQGALTLGRDESCTLRPEGGEISRVHARIEHRRGKFVLVDQSANGTWLAPDGRHTVQLHREEALLVGEGTIYLGSDPELGLAEPIRFRTLDRPEEADAQVAEDGAEGETA
jgi:class 3 adenylate cyclase